MLVSRGAWKEGLGLQRCFWRFFGYAASSYSWSTAIGVDSELRGAANRHLELGHWTGLPASS